MISSISKFIEKPLVVKKLSLSLFLSLPISLHSSALPLRSHALYPSNKARSHRSAVSVAKGECSYHLISLTYHLHAHKIQLETSLSLRSTMCNCSFVQRWLAIDWKKDFSPRFALKNSLKLAIVLLQRRYEKAHKNIVLWLQGTEIIHNKLSLLLKT